MKKACSWWAIIYTLAIFLILPLYVENSYFNLIAAKRHIFTGIAVVLIPVGIVLFLIAAIKKKLDPLKLNLMDICIIAIAGISLLSCLISDNISASFWGSEGWGIGAFAWICLALSYFLVSRCFSYNQNIWLPVIAVNIGIIIIGLMQAAGLDPFSMHKGMISEQIFSYFSTIGNTNWWSGYLCLFMPLTVAFLIQAETRVSRIIYLIFWGALSAAVLICAADGILVGLGVCAFAAVPYLFKNSRMAWSAGWLMAVFGAVLLVYTLMPCFAERISQTLGIAGNICRPWLGAALLAAGCLMIVLFEKFGGKLPGILFRIIIIVLEAALCVTAVIFLVKTVLEYEDNWGTLRGKIWNDSIELFRQFSFKEKIIGVGPEMLKARYVFLSDWFGQNVKVSHSEPLQYLLSMGLAGALCWYGIWISAVIYFIKNRDVEKGKITFLLPLIAYFAQAHVNSSMTTNMALLFLFLAFFRMPETMG